MLVRITHMSLLPAINDFIIKVVFLFLEFKCLQFSFAKKQCHVVLWKICYSPISFGPGLNIFLKISKLYFFVEEELVV